MGKGKLIERDFALMYFSGGADIEFTGKSIPGPGNSGKGADK